MIKSESHVIRVVLILTLINHKCFTYLHQFTYQKVKKGFGKSTTQLTEKNIIKILKETTDTFRNRWDPQKKAKLRNRVSGNVSKKILFNFTASRQQFQFDFKLNELNVFITFSKINRIKFLESRKYRRFHSIQIHRRSARNDFFFQNQRIGELLLDTNDVYPLHQLDENDKTKQNLIPERVFPDYKTNLKEENEFKNKMNEYDYVEKFCKNQKINK